MTSPYQTEPVELNEAYNELVALETSTTESDAVQQAIESARNTLIVAISDYLEVGAEDDLRQLVEDCI